jgi:hypothetical protein
MTFFHIILSKSNQKYQCQKSEKIPGNQNPPFIWPNFSAGQAGKLCQEMATLTGSQHFWAFAAVSTSCPTSRGANTVLIRIVFYVIK